MQMFRMYDLILKKRNGGELSADEIRFIVDGYTAGRIPDYQMSAMLMAIYFVGCNDRETLDLTLAMAHSGDMLNLDMIRGIKVDKHSTGGVGDKVSLVVAPVAAACGVPVAKMSGRGLGFTGGTIDKLESIPGFVTALGEDEFVDNVNEHGIAIMSQTADLAPADRLLYALRDVTGTVENMSLIASSIMSKKIAAGANAIVLDVTCGSGAFMKKPDDARELAEKMVRIGKDAHINTCAVITGMDEPLGSAVGNSLEVIEAIDTLKGQSFADVHEVCMEIAAQMIHLGGRADSIEKAREMAEDSISSGSALKKLAELIHIQHGDEGCIYDTERFAKAPLIKAVTASSTGFVHSIKCDSVGECVRLLGGGRTEKGQKIDLSVGLKLLKKKGDRVAAGDEIAWIYAADPRRASEAETQLKAAYEISAEQPEKDKLILDIIR